MTFRKLVVVGRKPAERHALVTGGAHEAPENSHLPGEAATTPTGRRSYAEVWSS
jgi:hypothetical protein